MYGTVARMKVKPGAVEALKKLSAQDANAGMAGYVGQYVYQMDNDPNELFLTVLFKDKKSYVANADSPEQNERYKEMAQYFAAEPDWHDGEIIFSDLK
jgi:quinol monooxygenase YgiN